MRRWWHDTEAESALPRLVLPTPGTSSTSRWPPATRQVTASRMASSLPCTTRAMFATSRSNSSAAKDASSSTGWPSVTSRAGAVDPDSGEVHARHLRARGRPPRRSSQHPGRRCSRRAPLRLEGTHARRSSRAQADEGAGGKRLSGRPASRTPGLRTRGQAGAHEPGLWPERRPGRGRGRAPRGG